MAAPASKSAPSSAPIASAAPAATHLLVSSKKAGFRRGGRSWPEAWVAVELSALTADQLAQIEKEPMLFARRCTAAEAAEVAASNPIEKLGPLEQLQKDNGELRAELAGLKRQVAELVEHYSTSRTPPPLGS